MIIKVTKDKDKDSVRETYEQYLFTDNRLVSLKDIHWKMLEEDSVPSICVYSESFDEFIDRLRGIWKQ